MRREEERRGVNVSDRIGALEPSTFTNAWKVIEAARPLPRRMRNFIIWPFEKMRKVVMEEEPAVVAALVDSLYSGDVYVLKKAYPAEFFIQLREQLHAQGQNTPSEFYPMVEGVPNFHRLIDAELTKKYSFESVKHAYYFFPWNADPWQIFSQTYPQWRIIKKLCGLRPEEYEQNTPKDGMVDRLQVAHYPAGVGHIETHSDPYQVHRLIIACFMSKRGKDYQAGGVYFIDRQNQKVNCEDYLDIGDMQIYFPTILHGVDTVDEGTPLDWNSPAGRWWFGPFSNSSNQVEKRHQGFGVKDIEAPQREKEDH